MMQYSFIPKSGCGKIHPEDFYGGQKSENYGHHRGASAYESENTLEAFELAVEQGADGIELDVQMTKDGSLMVIIHDENRQSLRMVQAVKDYTLEELKRFQVSTPEGKKGRIPELGEVLELVKPSGIKVNIELKTGIFWYPELERMVIEEVKHQGMEDRIIYSSFNHYSITEHMEKCCSTQAWMQLLLTIQIGQ